MSPASTRTLKEARALLYPWCAVMVVCALPFLNRHSNSGYALSRPNEFIKFCFEIGVVLGVPLLACLSFGNEFRHKTLELLVSQPVNRLQIWREKWSVAVAAVLTVALLAFFSSDFGFRVGRPVQAGFLLFLVVTMCSAAFWTLLARSTMGGLVLNFAAFIPLISIATSLWEWNSTSGFLGKTSAFLILAAATSAYSALMLCLGRWMLVKRQSGGGITGPDLMTAIPNVMPARLSALFRCGPNHVVLNLIRKELRLLRPLWLFAALYIAGWIALAFSFSFVPAGSPWQRTLLVILVMVSATYPVIALFLSACLSYGEERAFGIQMWHMALPLSMNTQWLAKLLVALFSGTFCAIAIPAALTALAQSLLRPDFVRELALRSILEPAPLLFMFFLFTFWCAVVVRDLTRTAGLVVAAGGLLALAWEGGYWIATGIGALLDEVSLAVISSSQLNPYFFADRIRWLSKLSHIPQWLLPGAILAVMTIHTCSLFRRLPEERTLKIIRPLMPYLAGVLAVVSIVTIGSSCVGCRTSFDLLADVQKAVAKLQPEDGLKVEDLTKSGLLSRRTERWLSNSTMTLSISDNAAVHGSGRIFHVPTQGKWKVYNLTIQLASGSTCKVSFPFNQLDSRQFWFGFSTCK